MDEIVKEVAGAYESQAETFESFIRKLPPVCGYCTKIIGYPTSHSTECKWTPAGWVDEGTDA